MSSSAELFAPIALLEETVQELEKRNGDPDVWRERLSEARLELDGAIADLHALQRDHSPIAAEFASRLGSAQSRVAAVERAGPPVAAPPKPEEDPLDWFVRQFGSWLGGAPAALEPVLVLLNGARGGSELAPMLDLCLAANVHIAAFDLFGMPAGKRATFYACLDYLRSSTPLAVSDVVLAVDGRTPIAQPLAKEFRELYELGKWRARMKGDDVYILKCDLDLVRRFYLAQTANFLNSSPGAPADSRTAFATRVNSALCAFTVADRADRQYLPFGKPEQHRRRWLGAAHELMGDVVCVDVAPSSAAIKDTFLGCSVDYYVASNDLPNSRGLWQIG